MDSQNTRKTLAKQHDDFIKAINKRLWLLDIIFKDKNLLEEVDYLQRLVNSHPVDTVLLLETHETAYPELLTLLLCIQFSSYKEYYLDLLNLNISSISRQEIAEALHDAIKFGTLLLARLLPTDRPAQFIWNSAIKQTFGHTHQM